MKYFMSLLLCLFSSCLVYGMEVEEKKSNQLLSIEIANQSDELVGIFYVSPDSIPFLKPVMVIPFEDSGALSIVKNSMIYITTRFGVFLLGPDDQNRPSKIVLSKFINREGSLDLKIVESMSYDSAQNIIVVVEPDGTVQITNRVGSLEAGLMNLPEGAIEKTSLPIFIEEHGKTIGNPQASVTNWAIMNGFNSVGISFDKPASSEFMRDFIEYIKVQIPKRLWYSRFPEPMRPDYFYFNIAQETNRELIEMIVEKANAHFSQ